MTRMQGSGARRTSRPSRRGLSWSDAVVTAMACGTFVTLSSRCPTPRRGSFDPVPRRRGSPRIRACFRLLDGLDGMAAELVPQRGGHLRGELDFVARGKAGEERRCDHRSGDVLVDRLGDRPAPFARVLDVRRDVLELRAVL